MAYVSRARLEYLCRTLRRPGTRINRKTQRELLLAVIPAADVEQELRDFFSNTHGDVTAERVRSYYRSRPREYVDAQGGVTSGGDVGVQDEAMSRGDISVQDEGISGANPGVQDGETSRGDIGVQDGAMSGGDTGVPVSTAGDVEARTGSADSRTSDIEYEVCEEDSITSADGCQSDSDYVVENGGDMTDEEGSVSDGEEAIVDVAEEDDGGGAVPVVAELEEGEFACTVSRPHYNANGLRSVTAHWADMEIPVAFLRRTDQTAIDNASCDRRAIRRRELREAALARENEH
jgi:hypothetical protein